MFQTIKDTAAFIKAQISGNPEVGIVLGTGLGGLVSEIEIEKIISYNEIPNFPVSTVEGHSGQLIFGKLSGKFVIAMKGRFHYYEGYALSQVVLPIRVMAQLGIKNLFLSNASGGVNPDFEIGDLMVINDHINLIPNPLIGKHEPEFGVRFPDMGQAYNPTLIHRAGEVAKALGIKLMYGVYTATTGPTYETPAEYRYFRIIGSDAVGMSTVPEVIVANQMGIPCFAMSIITDLGVPGKIVTITHEDVQKVAAGAEKKMTQIFKKLIADL
ncbi:MAG: purine-nucleoside phosphorylase [Bacteroidales bacterium]|nr:purine-nucleoside phosphorylase [Bacteroidales bacterium]HOY37934.1 purine-nucleoside phosphorylase [Bacteroidales bacterium]HQP03519.1 purine-nucleoside phosphorylase [Bacteroidales bacterium]